jgi:hypothetical protein
MSIFGLVRMVNRPGRRDPVKGNGKDKETRTRGRRFEAQQKAQKKKGKKS